MKETMKNKKHYFYNENEFKMKDVKTGKIYKLEVSIDTHPENPREWSNVSTMVCWHNYYALGDDHDYSDADDFLARLCVSLLHKSWDETDNYSLEEMLEMLNTSNKILIKPLNLYDHSRISISTSNAYPYNDSWDAGCVGFVYITKKEAFKELCEYVLDENGEKIKEEHKHPNGISTWSHKTQPLTDTTWGKRAEEVIENEVKIYDQYLRDEVYQYELTELIPVYGCIECEEEVDVLELLNEKQISFDSKIHYYCPHCGADLGNEDKEELNVVILEELEGESECCYGFYEDNLEDSGILDNISSDLEIIED